MEQGSGVKWHRQRAGMAAWSAAVCLGLCGCSVDTYEVGLASEEVRQSTLHSLSAHGDGLEGRARLEFGWDLGGELDGSCPRVADSVEAVIETEQGSYPLTITERGSGSKGVRCAIKCDELVGLKTTCRPVRAELEGGAAAQVQQAEWARVSLREAGAHLEAGFLASDFEPRAVTVERAAAVEQELYGERMLRVPFRWSHEHDVLVTGADVDAESPLRSAFLFDAYSMSEEEQARFPGYSYLLRVFPQRATQGEVLLRIHAEGAAPAECGFGACAPTVQAVQQAHRPAEW